MDGRLGGAAVGQLRDDCNQGLVGGFRECANVALPLLGVNFEFEGLLWVFGFHNVWVGAYGFKEFRKR